MVQLIKTLNLKDSFAKWSQKSNICPSSVFSYSNSESVCFSFINVYIS